jgi:hypothetical protein
VPYGRSGDWAVSVWVRFGNLFGNGALVSMHMYQNGSSYMCHVAQADEALCTSDLQVPSGDCGSLCAGSNSYFYSHWNVSAASKAGLGNEALFRNQVRSDSSGCWTLMCKLDSPLLYSAT